MFDITDTQNKYNLCKKCGGNSVGLRTRKGRIAVECDCGNRGPEIPAWLELSCDDRQSWEVDKLAFDGWNAL
jgi:hypothetical protein